MIAPNLVSSAMGNLVGSRVEAFNYLPKAVELAVGGDSLKDFLQVNSRILADCRQSSRRGVFFIRDVGFRWVGQIIRFPTAARIFHLLGGSDRFFSMHASVSLQERLDN